MDKADNPDNKPEQCKEQSLPLSQSAPAKLPLEAPTQPPGGQQNIAVPPPDEPPHHAQDGNLDVMPVRIVNDPLRTREIGEGELGAFERTTLFYAKGTFVVTFLTFVAIVGTAVVFWDQFREMNSQTDILAISARQARRDSAAASVANEKQLTIAQQQAKAAQDSANAIQQQTEIGARPWIELSQIAIIGGMTINMKGEANSQVYAVAKNIGKTPAREVSLWIELGEHYTEHREIHRLCTMDVAAPKDSGKYGQVLFPDKTLGEGENQNIGIKLKPLTLVERKQAGTGYNESLRLDKNGPPPSQEELIYPIPSSVIGCIQYKSFTSDVPYYTGFIYELLPMTKGREMFGYNIHFDRKTGNASDVPSAIPKENGTVTIPLEWLRLTPNRGWGNDIVK